jgi:tetratricopeptide (TPR) repeat protein
MVAAGLSLLPSFAQTKGGTVPTGTSGGGVTAPSIPTTRPTNPSPESTPAPGTVQPIFLTGQVLLEDGTVPTGQVTIERVCHGQSHAIGYADGRGNFSVQLFDRNSGVLQDASEDTGYRNSMPGMGGSGGVGGAGQAGGSQAGIGGMSTSAQDRALLDCELRARAAGYRSQSIMLANRRPLDPPDVGVILLHRMSGDEQGSTVSAVSLAAPKDARKAYNHGLEALKKEKHGDALADFEKAVESYPDYSAAWFEIGRLELATGDNAAARHAFETAIRADSKFVPPYLELSIVELRAQKWQALADVTEKAVRLNSFDYPEAFYYNAVANYYLKNMDQAEKSAREADRLDTHHTIPQNHDLLGVILAQRGDYAGAADQFRAYLKLAPDSDNAPKVRQRLNQVEAAGEQAKAKQN